MTGIAIKENGERLTVIQNMWKIGVPATRKNFCSLQLRLEEPQDHFRPKFLRAVIRINPHILSSQIARQKLQPRSARPHYKSNLILRLRHIFMSEVFIE